MQLDTYQRMDGLALAACIREGKATPDEVLDTALDLINKHNPALNAVVTLHEDKARDAIRNGLPQGPFTGVPLLLKDLFTSWAGTASTHGSNFASEIPVQMDSVLVARLKAAGFVLVGYTSSPEYGLCTTTEPVRYGPTRNPWNTNYSAGGSSGGAAAAVASGMIPIGHASDGGGSIRIPAACCGLFGMKPTRARISPGPFVGEAWNGMAESFALSRTVRDSAAVLDAVAGPSPGDPYWAQPAEAAYLTQVTTPPRPLRIACIDRSFNDAPVNQECHDATKVAVALCEQLGHTVVDANPAINPEEFVAATFTIITVNTARMLDFLSGAIGRTCTEEDVEKATWYTAELGRQVPATEFQGAIETIHKISRVIGRFLEEFDVILTPTMATPVPEIGWINTMGSDDDAYRERIFKTIAFTSLFNATGNPAMSVPLTMDSNQLPLGIQFAGRYADETSLFQLAGQLERSTPWIEKLPCYR